MSYHRGPERTEVELLPACLEDYVGAEAPVRFIDAYVEGLEVEKLGFGREKATGLGRPPYHPKDLLKLYLYGYLHRIRSSRRLEAEASRNLEVIWLLRRLRPDFKTIANFRKDYRAGFKPLLREFNLLCRKLELFGAELVAIDGSKFKASNSRSRLHARHQVEELLARVDARIEEYLRTLDQSDTEAEGAGTPPTSGGLREKLTQLQERRGRYQEWLEEMAAEAKNEIAQTDPECRKMKRANGGHEPGYNVQVAVDAKHHLIVAEEVVNEANDLGQLHAMAAAAKEALAVEQLAVVADIGYHQADQLEACEQEGLTTFVPAQARPNGRTKEGVEILALERFTYDAASDTYTCPGGQVLPRRGVKESWGRTDDLYYERASCASCPLRTQCTTSTHRVIARLPNQVVVDRAAARVHVHPEVVAQRKEIVEHVFGTLRLWGHDSFLLRGLAKVRAEFSLSALAYNLRRVLNLLGVDRLLQALQP